jgi:hypothetical protein
MGSPTQDYADTYADAKGQPNSFQGLTLHTANRLISQIRGIQQAAFGGLERSLREIHTVLDRVRSGALQ